MHPNFSAGFVWKGQPVDSFADVFVHEQTEGAVLKILRQLYFQNKDLRQKLAATGSRPFSWRGSFAIPVFASLEINFDLDNAYLQALAQIRTDIKDERDTLAYLTAVLGLETVSAGRPRVELSVSKEGVPISSLALDFEPNGYVTIGKADESQLRAQHPSVSRQHCIVFSTKGSVVVIDLGSANGTSLDGRAVTPFVPTAIKDQQVLRLGRSAREYLVKLDSREAERYHRDENRRLRADLARVKRAAETGDDRRLLCDDSTELTLSNLPWSLTRGDLADFMVSVKGVVAFRILQKNGEVDRSTMAETLCECGSSLVVFDTSDDAAAGALFLEGQSIRGRLLHVRKEPVKWTSGDKLLNSTK
ncbi:MAG: hypothetical protein KVP17_002185 [Porospora cf. gigantea B]|nr:MAG: hypothetical protein KVP17_002185 [Porospora cf. gigantea B]